MKKRTAKLNRPRLLVRMETAYGSATEPQISVHFLREPLNLMKPFRDDVRTMHFEGRVELTPKGVRKAATFFRSVADRLEGFAHRRTKKYR